MARRAGLSSIIVTAAASERALAFSVRPHASCASRATSGRHRRCQRRGGATTLAATECEPYVLECRDDEGAGFSAERFASTKCWGRRPLLMRGAFDPKLLLDDGDDEADPAWPSWDDVVDISTDDDSESRIISHIPGDPSSFELEWGPMSEQNMPGWLSSNPSSSSEKERRETLVVNDVDRFYPPLADWMFDTFSFLPNWRMDDGQISLAEEGGGIGPHVDNYDVFLIQMSGTRTWQVGTDKLSAQVERDRSVPGLDVRVLEDWGVSDPAEMEEWVVRPGDVLYLPPRVAHCGTALTDGSMTLSVGCRAPSVSDLVSRLAEELSSSIHDLAVRRYTDEDLLEGADGSAFSPGEITPEAKRRARDLVMDSLGSLVNDDGWWDGFFGRYVTEQKRVRNNYPIPLGEASDYDDDDNDDLPDEWCDPRSAVRSVLAGNGALYQAEGIAFATSSTQTEGGWSHRFYANGEAWHSESQSDDDEEYNLGPLFRIVADNRKLDRETLLNLHGENGAGEDEPELAPAAIAFLEELLSIGVLYGAED